MCECHGERSLLKGHTAKPQQGTDNVLAPLLTKNDCVILGCFPIYFATFHIDQSYLILRNMHITCLFTIVSISINLLLGCYTKEVTGDRIVIIRRGTLCIEEKMPTEVVYGCPRALGISARKHTGPASEDIVCHPVCWPTRSLTKRLAVTLVTSHTSRAHLPCN